MFDISFGEILIICLVAVLVVGPSDMPDTIRTAGRWFRAFRKTVGEFKKTFSEVLEDEEINEAIRDVRRVDSEVRHITGDDGKKYAAYDISDIEDASRKKPSVNEVKSS